jgi:hypothetical protein
MLTHSCCLIIVVAATFEQALGKITHGTQISLPPFMAFFCLSKV